MDGSSSDGADRSVDDDEPVPYGIDVPGIALDRQVSCPHGFDSPYCPFGCA